jgi:hypothetical protein
MKRTAVHLADQQLERLRVASHATGLSVAEIIRRAVDLHVPPVIASDRPIGVATPEVSHDRDESRAAGPPPRPGR